MQTIVVWQFFFSRSSLARVFTCVEGKYTSAKRGYLSCKPLLSLSPTFELYFHHRTAQRGRHSRTPVVTYQLWLFVTRHHHHQNSFVL